jgi:hypothetical protein
LHHVCCIALLAANVRPHNVIGLKTSPCFSPTGDLPKVPTLPQRSLLLRKLVQYEQLARPQQQLEQPPVPSQKQQVRRLQQRHNWPS